MNSVPAGWYPDPQQPGQQRYWDGAQWTEHIAGPPEAAPQAAPPQAAPPPGWYPDPDKPGQNRRWDGAQWTDEVQIVPLFDGMVRVGILRKKEQRLYVSAEEMWWGEEHVRWTDVTWFSQLVTIQNGVESMYEIWLQRGDNQMHMLFARMSRRNDVARRAYDVILEQLRRTLGTRVLNGLLEMVERGQPIRTAGLILSPQGFAEEDKGETVPWSEYAGMEVGGHQSVFVQLYRTKDGGKRKRACRVKVDMLRAWVVPPVVEEHVRRYTGPPVAPVA